MDYQEDLEFDNMERELNLRILIMKTMHFHDLFPNLKKDIIKYSEEENIALNMFKQKNEVLYEIIKEELDVIHALSILKRRCYIECYKRLNLPIAKDYWDNEDVISIVSDKDLINLLTLIKRFFLK